MHPACSASATGLQDGPRARTRAERWAHVHGLLGKGIGLLECSRRLGLGLNTVKRYARASAPERRHCPVLSFPQSTAVGPSLGLRGFLASCPGIGE